MALHGGRSPKRSMFMGNMSSLGGLDKGKLTKAERVKRTKISTARSLIINSCHRMHACSMNSCFPSCMGGPAFST